MMMMIHPDIDAHFQPGHAAAAAPQHHWQQQPAGMLAAVGLQV
jgi:hypothetical protein